MGVKERNLITRRLASTKPNERLFRINAGLAWIAEKSCTFRASKAMTVTVAPGDMILRRARPFHGAPPGFPDMIGWQTVEITPEMVGQKIAVFTGIEAKATGDLSPEQRKFRDVLEAMGGVFRVLK